MRRRFAISSKYANESSKLPKSPEDALDWERTDGEIFSLE
jgi:hypothetical protein